jgi:hypothetical protein
VAGWFRLWICGSGVPVLVLCVSAPSVNILITVKNHAFKYVLCVICSHSINS